MTVTQTGRRVVLVGLIALVAALLPFTSATAQDSGDTQVQIALDSTDTVTDSVELSIIFSNLQFPDGGADDVILVTDAEGADALSSGSIADAAPLLFVDPEVGVEQAHVDEITRLGASRVILIGDTDAISQDIEDDINDADLITLRLGGATRIETANEVADFLYCRADTSSSTNCEDTRTDTDTGTDTDSGTDTDTDTLPVNTSAVHLSRAFGTPTNPMTAYADAAGLGAWAAQTGVATVLTDTDTLTDSTGAFYMENPSITRSVTIGGVNAVSDAVLAELAATYQQDVATRVFDADNDVRAGTAIAVNVARGLDTDSDTLAGVVFIDGYADDFFIDAYALAGVAGTADYAVVLTNGAELAPETAEYISSLEFDSLDIIATPNVDAIDAIEAATGQTLTTYP